MLIHHEFIRTLHARIDLLGDKRHFGDLFQDGGVVHGAVGILAEREHAVAFDENAGDFDGIELVFLEPFDNHEPGILFIFALDLFLR